MDLDIFDYLGFEVNFRNNLCNSTRTDQLGILIRIPMVLHINSNIYESSHLYVTYVSISTGTHLYPLSCFYSFHCIALVYLFVLFYNVFWTFILLVSNILLI